MSSTAVRRTARPLIAVVVALALVASLVPSALASTGTITQSDCNQGTIKDTSGTSISKARCEKLIGKSVRLAGTGLDLWPLTIAGVVCLGGAAALTLRARRPTRTLA